MDSDGQLRETPSSKVPQLFPDAVYVKLQTAKDSPQYAYDGFNSTTDVLKKGHAREAGYRPFTVDTVYSRDVAVQVRDGAKLYGDIFRPVSSDQDPVPVIIPWSPYGKTGTGAQNYDHMAPHRAGIAKDRTSGYEKFEVRHYIP
jgi:predicted acyl esterase